MDQINNIPDDQIQFVINDQLFLETLLMELRGKSISFSSYKKKASEKKRKRTNQQHRIFRRQPVKC